MKNTTHPNGNTERDAKQRAIPSLAELNIRDWFAGQALAGCNSDDQELVAKWCYEMADVMLAVRNKGNEK